MTSTSLIACKKGFLCIFYVYLDCHHSKVPMKRADWAFGSGSVRGQNCSKSD